MTSRTNEVLVLLDGSELPQCKECCAPAFSLETRYRSNETHYFIRATITCEQGHTRVLVSSPRYLDDEMRLLLA
jgi:hypothetical protein